MDYLTSIAAWVAGAVIVVGLIQAAKSAITGAPSWLWLVVMLVVSVAAAFAAGTTRPWFDALGIAATSQLGYELIVQGAKKKIASMMGEKVEP